jgi:hypothetical protein
MSKHLLVQQHGSQPRDRRPPIHWQGQVSPPPALSGGSSNREYLRNVQAQALVSYPHVSTPEATAVSSTRGYLALAQPRMSQPHMPPADSARVSPPAALRGGSAIQDYFANVKARKTPPAALPGGFTNAAWSVSPRPGDETCDIVPPQSSVGERNWTRALEANLGMGLPQRKGVQWAGMHDSDGDVGSVLGLRIGVNRINAISDARSARLLPPHRHESQPGPTRVLELGTQQQGALGPSTHRGAPRLVPKV